MLVVLLNYCYMYEMSTKNKERTEKSFTFQLEQMNSVGRLHAILPLIYFSLCDIPDLVAVFLDFLVNDLSLLRHTDMTQCHSFDRMHP